MKALMLLVLKRAFSISFDSTELFYEIAFVIECASNKASARLA